MKEKIKENISQNKVGEISYNIFNSKMTIINYINSKNILIEFENGYTVRNQYNAFKTGNIKSPYDKSIYNVGYQGEGIYKPTIDLEKRKTPQYDRWYDMMRRCYSEKRHIEFPTYKDCVICDEWHNFQNFAKWYDENFYEIDGETMCLDKDILHKGNKTYSPETCIFVPNNINVLFTKSNSKRGEYPIGVSFRKDNNKYKSSCSDGSKIKISLGQYDSSEEAFNAYKKFKENLIKQVADKYKSQIPRKLYDIMYSYEVEITD